MEQKINKEMEDFWLNKLTFQQKKTRVERSLLVLKKVADIQLNKIKVFGKTDELKQVRFTYFQNTLANLWENIDFALALGKGKNKKFAFYPARNVFENTLRLIYFSKQNEETQNDIATREILRISKRLYDFHRIDDPELAESSKKDYNIVASLKPGKYPSIEDGNTKDPFPDMATMIKASGIDTELSLYYQYQDLCESTHGKLISIMKTAQNELAEYVRCIMYSGFMAIKLLQITDFHLQHATKEQVEKAIKQAESISFKK